ncbi:MULTISPECIES: fluoride efflux transporter CrcB [Atopobiaceae]|uniref:fluoride efflux transporter CrcB n=1 Tax=Atopobiaceae TaxID=1643824 RepID=UPI000B386869|nr:MULTISPECIES: fluoride efflux transporter CrcB [Atopobiaceae]MCR8908550.1 fluoride efflux transporter CrcB [Thermophilibacter sp. ET337]OUO33282.1 chromosome condensation protein CrcB [Olsenella sp. An293]
MLELIAVATGGAVGSVARWGLGRMLSAWLPGLPAGTFVANVAAGLVIGLISGAHAVSPLPEPARLALTVGLCGGLSTFSTFSNETLQMAEAGNLPGAAANVLLNVSTCLAAVWLGTRLGGQLASLS